MTSKEKIQQEIEQTMQCLDGAKRAEANPFLFTRIQARMNKDSNRWEERTFSFISRPIIAVAIVLVVMAVNGWALWDGNGSNEVLTAGNGNTNVPELASEYNVVASVDNYENMTNE